MENELLLSPPTPVRQPAEFEPMEGVLIRYPFGISYQVIKEMAKDATVVTIVADVSQKNTVLTNFQNQGVNIDNCEFLIAPSNTHWTRDYGPWFIFNGYNEQGVTDFTYNRPRPSDNLIPSAYAANQSLPLYNMPLVHTGGNYMTDGQGISISTDLVWSENSGYTQSQIRDIVMEYLGVHTYHVVPDANGDYIKHIDCWAKYLSPTKIMIREVPPSHPRYNAIESAVSYFEAQLSCYDIPYDVVRVYTPNNEPYTNSLILNNKVLVPITGSQWDAAALTSYEDAMPGYEVLGFTGSWQSTDALHCRTMGITDRHMLYIEHTPLFGSQEGNNGYTIQTKIYPYSGENIISSTTGVHWKVEGQDWNFISLQPLGNHQYHATIPGQENGSQISYYIQAEDESGRIENHPYIGAPDPHTFTAYNDNNTPDTPQRPTGPASGKAGSTYRYSTSTIDIDGDMIFYIWDWGNGNNSEWLGPYESGVEISTMNSWDEEGSYEIRVKAKDAYGEESDWSEPLAVTMPKNSLQSMPLLQKIGQIFPGISQLISVLLSIF
ncbi:MAG: agmatine deiminase family protein [Thermoplasmatota archaeon]